MEREEKEEEVGYDSQEAMESTFSDMEREERESAKQAIRDERECGKVHSLAEVNDSGYFKDIEDELDEEDGRGGNGESDQERDRNVLEHFESEELPHIEDDETREDPANESVSEPVTTAVYDEKIKDKDHIKITGRTIKVFRDTTLQRNIRMIKFSVDITERIVNVTKLIENDEKEEEESSKKQKENKPAKGKKNGDENKESKKRKPEKKDKKRKRLRRVIVTLENGEETTAYDGESPKEDNVSNGSSQNDVESGVNMDVDEEEKSMIKEDKIEEDNDMEQEESLPVDAGDDVTSQDEPLPQSLDDELKGLLDEDNVKMVKDMTEEDTTKDKENKLEESPKLSDNNKKKGEPSQFTATLYKTNVEKRKYVCYITGDILDEITSPLLEFRLLVKDKNSGGTSSEERFELTKILDVTITPKSLSYTNIRKILVEKTEFFGSMTNIDIDVKRRSKRAEVVNRKFKTIQQGNKLKMSDDLSEDMLNSERDNEIWIDILKNTGKCTRGFGKSYFSMVNYFGVAAKVICRNEKNISMLDDPYDSKKVEFLRELSREYKMDEDKVMKYYENNLGKDDIILGDVPSEQIEDIRWAIRASAVYHKLRNMRDRYGHTCLLETRNTAMDGRLMQELKSNSSKIIRIMPIPEGGFHTVNGINRPYNMVCLFDSFTTEYKIVTNFICGEEVVREFILVESTEHDRMGGQNTYMDKMAEYVRGKQNEILVVTCVDRRKYFLENNLGLNGMVITMSDVQSNMRDWNAYHSKTTLLIDSAHAVGSSKFGLIFSKMCGPKINKVIMMGIRHCTPYEYGSPFRDMLTMATAPSSVKKTNIGGDFPFYKVCGYYKDVQELVKRLLDKRDRTSSTMTSICYVAKNTFEKASIEKEVGKLSDEGREETKRFLSGWSTVLLSDMYVYSLKPQHLLVFNPGQGKKHLTMDQLYDVYSFSNTKENSIAVIGSEIELQFCLKNKYYNRVTIIPSLVTYLTKTSKYHKKQQETLKNAENERDKNKDEVE